MKRKIGAPKGRQLYGAPKGAPIMPNMVIISKITLFPCYAPLSLFAWCDTLPDALHNALFMALTLFSRKNSENHGKSPNFGDFPQFLRKILALRDFF